MRILARRAAASLLGTAGVLCLLSGSAAAQQVSPGATIPLLGIFVRGVDTATDANGNHLVVGGQGSLQAVCTNGQGAAISGLIPVSATGGYSSFPRAIYSPLLFNGAGGFMLAWAEAPGDPAGNIMRGLFTRAVSCTGAVGPANMVSGAVWWEPGNIAIGHSRSSQNFLVAWQTPGHTVSASLVDLNGAASGPTVALSSGMGRDPGVTWNPNTNHYGVSFSGETYSAFATVPAWNAAAFSRNTFNVSAGILTTMTDVVFNPYTGLYVMTWFELPSALAKIAEFDSAGNLVTLGAASGRLGSYDSLSLALSMPTGTFLLVGSDRRIDTPLGLELNGRGFPFNGENTLSSTRPIYYPRVSASPTSSRWNVVFSGNFANLSALTATSYALAGGPAGAHPALGAPAPAPTPTAPTPSACPGTAPVAGWVCVSGNWLPPDHPAAGGAAPPPPPPPAPAPTPAPAPSACPGAAPVAGWVCVNGGWLPPDHPLAIGSAPPPPPPPAPAPPAPTGCPTVQPGPGWTCVNGNWLPPGASSCTTVQPGAGWTCVNGNWLPPGSTAAPAPAPSSCTTPQPGAGWYCVNGGWVPPNSPLAPGNACVGSAPAAGWVCTASGGWVPPNHPLAGGGGD